MKCLETRTTPEGFKRRRYQSATGVRHTTIEVPIEVWRTLNGSGTARDRTAQALKALDRHSQRRQAVALVKQGLTGAEAARRLGCARRSVNRWVQQEQVK